MTTLAEMAVEVLTTADGREKTRISRAHAARWREARDGGAGDLLVPQMVDWMAKHLGEKA